MGRPGGGGGGGHSSGGHSMGGGFRPSGGHSMGGGSRPRSGGSFGGGPRSGGSFGGGPRGPMGGPGGGPRGPMGPGPGGPGPRGPMGPGPGPFWGGPRRPFWGGPRRRVGCFPIMIIIVILLSLVAFFPDDHEEPYYDDYSYSDDISTTTVREKVDSGNDFMEDCVIDEIGWFDDTSYTAEGLEYFWEETGVQPYVYFKSYDASLTTNEEKEAWTQDYYDENFDSEDIFLVIYFADEDAENEVGYSCYVDGYQAATVMDSEAVDIFWTYWDNYWYGDDSMDDMIINTFTSTADVIMNPSKTAAELQTEQTRKTTTGYTVIGAVLVIAIAALIVLIIHKRKADQAKERETILNTPIDELDEDIMKDNK